MSLKDNFNQAVKELLKRDGIVGNDAKEAKPKSEIDRLLETPAAPSIDKLLDDDIPPMPAETPIREVPNLSAAAPTPTPVTSVPEPAPAPTPSYTAPQPTSSATRTYTSTSTGSYGGSVPPVTPTRPLPTYGSQPSEPYFETEETTIISRNTIIDGNVRSFANINIEGSVKGDVAITKNANLSGKIVGNLECNNATMIGSSMQGSVASKGQVKMDRDSLILGDIQAQYLDLNGKVKGNVEIGGKAEFKTDAIIFGNINASTITVMYGATIQCYVITTFLLESVTNVFPEGIAVAE